MQGFPHANRELSCFLSVSLDKLLTNLHLAPRPLISHEGKLHLGVSGVPEVTRKTPEEYDTLIEWALALLIEVE